MSVLRMEAFAQYDGDAAQLLNSDNGWAAVRPGSELLVGEGRDGGDVLAVNGAANDVTFDAGARISLPAAADEAWVHFMYQTPQYPGEAATQGLLHAWSIAGSAGLLWSAFVNTAGGVDFYNAVGTLLGSAPNGTIIPGAQHAVAIHFKISDTIGELELWVEKVKVLDLSALDLGTVSVSLLTFSRNVASGGFGYDTNIGDIFIVDEVDDGEGNFGFMGDPRLVFLRFRADHAAAQGWTPQRRYMFGTGVLSLPNNNSAIHVADASAVRVGAGDFTAEAHVRFASLPTGSNKATIFSKWLETGDVRSWQLFYGGPSLNSNHLEVRVSTDGAAGTVTSPISVSWLPIVGRRYHVAIQVESGLVSLYIDGVRQSAPQAWPTPADNSSLFAFGGQQASAVGSFTANASLIGYADEVRFTKGVARYGAGFTPPSAAFPRSAPSDPDFSSVNLLIGFDNAIVDESAAPRVITAINSAIRYAPDDGPPNNYPVLLHGDRPDTYVEAAFLAASAFQTYTELPADADTTEADGETYTFKTALTPTAGEVLIGADVDETIDNLVAAMNGDAGSGTLYAAGTNPLTNAAALNRGLGQLDVTANTLGTAGNAIAVDSSNADNPWSGATLTGGADIPGPSEFVLDRLPPHTTGVLAAALIHRSRKTDSGDGSLQPSLVTADGSSEPGVDQPLTTNFIFYNSIITVDPATMGGLTPSTFINARLRLDRTA